MTAARRKFQADPPNKAGRKNGKEDIAMSAVLNVWFQADPPNKAGRKIEEWTISETCERGVSSRPTQQGRPEGRRGGLQQGSEVQPQFQADPPNKAGRKKSTGGVWFDAERRVDLPGFKPTHPTRQAGRQ